MRETKRERERGWGERGRRERGGGLRGEERQIETRQEILVEKPVHSPLHVE